MLSNEKQNEIVKFIKENSVVTDNISENILDRQNICMKARASILIDSYCTTGRFAPFMKAGNYDGRYWIYDLPQPYTFKINSQISMRVNTFAIHSGNICEKDEYEGNARWRLYINESLRKHIPCALTREDKDINAQYKPDAVNAQKDFKTNRPSQFDLCKHITPYNTPEKVCRFFDNASSVFSSLKLAGGTHRTDVFFDREEDSTTEFDGLKANNPGLTEEAFSQAHLRQFSGNLTDF